MKKRIVSAAVATLFIVWGGRMALSTAQVETTKAQEERAQQDQERYGLEAPREDAHRGEFHSCSADFALSNAERLKAIQEQLKATPRNLSRLAFTRLEAGKASKRGLEGTKKLNSIKLEDFPDLDSAASDPAPDTRRKLVQQDQALALIWEKVWPSNERELHVRFLNTHPSWAPIKAKIEQYAHEWENYADVRFVFDNAPNAQIRILLDDDDFSWSNIGTDAKLKPANAETMHYGWFNLTTTDEEFSRTVLHEFGHALGAIHEHQHPDAGIPWNKPVVYAYYASKQPPWTEEDVDTNLFNRYDRSILQYGVFDDKSIMMYPISPTFTTNGYSVGWNRVLSPLDKSVIAWVYSLPR